MSKHRTLKSAFISFIAYHPVWTILITSLFFLSLGPGILNLNQNFSYRVWFNEGDPLLERFDAFEKKFGSDAIAVLTIHSPSGIFDQDSASLIHELTTRMWQVPQVIRVNSLANYNWVHAEGDNLVVEPILPPLDQLTASLLNERRVIAIDHKVLRNLFISADGKTTLIQANLKPSLRGNPQYEPVVEALKKIIEEFQGRTDHSFYLSGNPVMTHSFKDVAFHDLTYLIPTLILMILIVLALLTKRMSGAILPVIVVCASVMVSLALAGWLRIDINNVTAALPQLILAVGIATSVHILSSYGIATRRGQSKQMALMRALEHNLTPTILTTLSTAIGFFSFSSAHVKPIANLGLMGGLGAIASWIAAIGILSPLLVLLPAPSSKTSKKAQGTPIADWAATQINRHKRSILASYALVSVIALAFSTKVEVDSNPFDYFDPEYPLKKSLSFTEQEIGGVWGPELVLSTGAEDGIKDPAFMQKAEKFQSWVDSLPEVTKTLSILDVLKATHKSLHNDDPKFETIPPTREAIAQELFLYSLNLPQGQDLNNQITTRSDALRISVFWTLNESNASLEMFDRMRKKGVELGLDLEINGKNMLYQSLNSYVVETFFQSMLIAIAAISLLLTILYRSIRTGILAMIPNLVPLILGGAFLHLLGWNLDIGTAVVTAVCLGISVDDTIHFISHYHESRSQGLGDLEAIKEIFRETAPALCTTTLVLVMGFGTLVLGDFVPNIHFGILSALIFTAALITDLTLMPAILLATGKKERPQHRPGDNIDTLRKIS